MKIVCLREEFEAEYQDKLAEYEEELRGWKKEAKRRVTRNVVFILCYFFIFNVSQRKQF